VNNGTNKSVNG